jgi:hypothetical protein
VITVYDLTTGTIASVPAAEARAGVLRYARSLGPGTPACGEWEWKALEITEEERS